MRKPHPAGRSDYADAIESLESRRLLAVTFNGGVIEIDGDAEANRVILSMAKGGSRLRVALDGKRSNFDTADVEEIEINLRGGKDRVTVDHTVARIDIPMLIRGGGGKDFLAGGDNRDTIFGGSGNDRIYGGAGNDFIEGEAGNDFVNALSGHDHAYGGAGNDKLYGSGGNDVLGGDDENKIYPLNQARDPDVVGNDRLNGGPGDDWLLGGNGADDIATEWLFPHVRAYNDDNGRDVFIPGPGADSVGIRGRDPNDPDFETGADDRIIGRDAEDTVPVEDKTGFIPVGGDYASHTHAYLLIRIHGQEYRVDEWVGSFGGEPVFHTHNRAENDPRGIQLHMHDTVLRPFLLKEFMENWGISLSSNHIGRFINGNGGSVRMTVNGVNNTEFENYAIQDEDRIVITFE